MSRIDLAKLRKRAGMSQRQLADLLQVRPSFLSAIENGRSRLPEEKERRIMEIFEIDSLEDYVIDTVTDVAPGIVTHSHVVDQNDSFTHLLTHFHDLAHKNASSCHDAEAAARIEFLTKRNDRLSQRVDDLRDEVDRLKEENLRLKELLVKNGIDY